MKTPLLYLCIFGIISYGEANDFYISTTGSDDWSGTLKEPDEQKNDGPFATLARARDAVRELKKSGMAKNIHVQIRGGHYRIHETIVFGVDDSGEGDFSIAYEAYPNEEPVFSSDVTIDGWKQLENTNGKIWVTDVSKKTSSFFTLYDGEKRLPRARSKGFIPVMPDSKEERSKSSRTNLHFPVGAIRNWSNLEGIDIVVRPLHAWVVNILPLQSVNQQTQIATVSIPATYAMNELHYLPGTDSVWVENAIDFLEEPGEWVFDSKLSKLYLWPVTEGMPRGITAPLLQEYLKIEGSIDEDGPTDIPVRNLIFRGLTLTRGESWRVGKDDKGLQHDWDMHDKANALVRLRGAESCTIEKCRFTHSGSSAIRLDLHAQKNRIQSNHIEHIGGTGILLCGYGPGTKDVNHHNLIRNNHIHHVGEIYPHSPGIFVWQSGDNRVVNNLIHHTPYSGIIVSGVMTSFFSKRDNNSRELVRTIRWQEVGKNRNQRSFEEVRRFLHTHDNLVEANEIHHAMEQLGDGNGIYIRGAGSGNIIRRNYIHHLVSPVALQSAIRTDGGQRDTLISENLIYRCTSQGIQLKLNNRAENNIIADLIEPIHKGEKRLPAYFKLREGPMTGAVIQRNILYHPGENAVFYDQGNSPRLPAAWAKQANTDHNLYYCAGNPNMSRAVLKKARRTAIDTNSRSADPLFVDPENGDFRFKPGSPAKKLGIVPIDLSKIGLQN